MSNKIYHDTKSVGSFGVDSLYLELKRRSQCNDIKADDNIVLRNSTKQTLYINKTNLPLLARAVEYDGHTCTMNVSLDWPAVNTYLMYV